jgi:hypothetical protein
LPSRSPIQASWMGSEAKKRLETSQPSRSPIRTRRMGSDGSSESTDCLHRRSFGFSLQTGVPARNRKIRGASPRDSWWYGESCSEKPNDPRCEPAGFTGMACCLTALVAPRGSSKAASHRNKLGGEYKNHLAQPHWTSRSGRIFAIRRKASSNCRSPEAPVSPAMT